MVSEGFRWLQHPKVYWIVALLPSPLLTTSISSVKVASNLSARFHLCLLVLVMEDNIFTGCDISSPNSRLLTHPCSSTIFLDETRLLRMTQIIFIS